MKILKITGIIASLIVGIAIICNITGFLKIYTASTVANEPAIVPGQIIAATNLADAMTGDFITYEANNNSYTHRLVAIENDTLEIIGGTVFVNGKDIDKNLSLKHTYKILQKDIAKVIPENNNAFIFPVDADYYLVQAGDSKVKNIQHIQLVDNKEKTDPLIKAKWNMNYNKDYFGPVTVPKNKIFVLGDNRDNSEDSRYIGFIDTKDIVGVLIR